MIVTTTTESNEEKDVLETRKKLFVLFVRTLTCNSQLCGSVTSGISYFDNLKIMSMDFMKLQSRICELAYMPKLIHNKNLNTRRYLDLNQHYYYVLLTVRGRDYLQYSGNKKSLEGFLVKNCRCIVLSIQFLKYISSTVLPLIWIYRSFTNKYLARFPELRSRKFKY